MFFVKQCIWALEYTWNRVNSFTPIIVILFFALIYLGLKKDSLINKCFVYPNVLFFLIMLNPVIENLLVYKYGLMERIHRFFWIIPITFILSYVVLELIKENGKKSYFLFCFVLVLWLILGRTMYEEPHYKTQNIYKIRNEVIEFSEIINGIEKSSHYTVFFNDININYMIRQYDPSFVLLMNPNALEEILLEEDLEEICVQSNTDDIYLLAAYFCKHYEVSVNKLLKAIRNAQLDYIILDYEEKALIEKGVVYLVEKTDNYYIYKVAN